MNILVIGAGGREHALCWAIAASPLVETLYCAPGNAGIAQEAACLAIDPLDFDAVVKTCRDKKIDLVVVGPEQPLVAGLVDRLQDEGIRAFGPRANAAILEGSKGFTKDLCVKYGIPTAAYGRFSDSAAAKGFIRRTGVPIVIKADGLAAGKGVVIAQSIDEADATIDEMLGGRFGDAGESLVIEEFLEGEEASYFALCDGMDVLPLTSAQDHKRVGDGDVGPNTGGMGAYSPAPVVDAAMEARILSTIIKPTVAAMAAEDRPFAGVLFAGVMITRDGPKLIEYNARFGDPECQVLMPRVFGDIVPVLDACANRQLRHVGIRWKADVALCVVIAAKGYPGEVEKGGEIRGLDTAPNNADTVIFHAGTKVVDGKVTANGGRVLGVTALGADVAAAQKAAYAAVDRIDWPGGFCRRDIGWRAVARA